MATVLFGLVKRRRATAALTGIIIMQCNYLCELFSAKAKRNLKMRSGAELSRAQDAHTKEERH